MPRRKDKAKVSPSPRHAVTPSMTAGQDLLRRVLLGLVTALIVARPLVATEDPGLRSPLPDPSGMVLTWLWLVALLGWMVWRFWTKQDGARFGLLDGALLAVVGLNLLSATAARYKYPAWLMTWEWLTFFIAFYLVRRLSVWPGVGDGLLAALLATAVMLSAYAAYQHVVEIPANAMLTRVELLAEMAQEGIFYSPDDPVLDQLDERRRSPNVFATFGHPNSFAGYLGLLLPAALGWTVAGRRANGWNWQTVLLALCTAQIVLALWWTHSRGAILAVLLVAAIGVIWLARRLIALRHLRALLGFAVLALALAFLAFFGLREKNVGKVTPQESFALRIGYWNATWKMIREQPWLGVGPGNFGRHYPAHMSATDYEEVQDPHNFALELWATCGFFGMVAMLVALGVCFRRVGSGQWAVSSTEADAALPTAHSPLPTAPWEFYFGGMAGLILGFLLHSWHQSTDEIIVGGATAGLRSLIWFPAFALFLSVRWAGQSRTLALVAGVAVLLLNLCVSDGLSVPAVAIPLWVVIALVVAVRDAQTKVGERSTARNGQFEFLRRLLPIPICAVLAMVYFGSFLQPTAHGASLARQSLKAQEYLRIAMYPQAGESVPAEWARAIRRDRAGFTRDYLLRPLQVASAANPEDTRYLRSLAAWTGVLWQMTRGDADRNAARDHALQAQIIDPLNRESWLAEADLEAKFGYHLQLQSWNPVLAVSMPWGPFPNLQLPPQPLGALVLRFNEPNRTPAGKSAQTEYEQAVTALREAVRLGPTQTHLRYQLVTGIQAAGHLKQAEREARQLLDLDRKTTHRSRKLTPQHREQVQRWLDSRSAK